MLSLYGDGQVCPTSHEVGSSRAGPITPTPGLNSCLAAASSNETQIWPQAQQMRPDRFEMHRACLCLLGDGVHVAEATFKGVAVKDRGGTGLLIGHVDDLPGLVDRKSGGHADGHALIERKGAGKLHGVPNIFERFEQKAPCGHQLRLGEPELLASCYRSSFALARARGLHTIAFPAISCGIYGYPIPDATEIAVRETLAELAANPELEQAVFACFSSEVFAAYRLRVGA